jgi:O-antigen/teichoic acid export membrane protein
VSVLILAVLVVRSDGPIPLSGPNLERARAFLAYSIKNQLVRTTDLVNYQSDKVVIAFGVGPAAAGAYELANRVAVAVRQVGVYATSAVDVELTTLFARFGLDRVRERFERLTEVAVTFAFPPMFLTMATAPLLLDVWLSHAPPNAEAVLVALSAAYLLSVSTGVGYGVAVAAGDPGVVAKTSVGAALANIALTVGLAPLFGIWGVLAGTVVALSGGAIAQVVLVQRRFALPARSYLDAVLPALAVYSALAVPVAALAYAHLFHGRGIEAVLLVVLSMTYLLLCGTWAARKGRLPPGVANRLPRLQWLRPSVDEQ